MSKQKEKHLFLSPFIKLEIICFLAAFCLFFVNAKLCVLPLVCFLSVSFAAPFFPTFGYYLPIISRGNPNTNAISLTFDDGPDSVTTPEVLRLLEKYKVKATFFVTGSSAAQHPLLIKEIVRSGHTIGNHSYNHDLFLMLRSKKILNREIESTQEKLSTLDICPLVFRPPVGITSPRLKKVLEKLGMICVNFSCRAVDGGNRRVKNISQKILKKVQPGDIVMLHDTCPKNMDLLPYWLTELELILTGIREKRLEILPLSELINKPVMQLNSQTQ
ncbi:MAG: polysaccharide deacetylase family protein [Sedimentisphaerales bacterium]|nr:polysaccharide deacetylase family protein [Sedimentisphaerales bacterium]